ncbi:MAG: 4Fe-4S dicluster domain-containing protein [Ignavibacteriales bacterium]
MSKVDNLKRVYAIEEKCAGCGLCQVYCAAAHSKYKNDIVKAYKFSDKKPITRVVFEERKPLTFALQCRHCEEAQCTKACITGAMQKDPETGIVTNDISRCIGCWSCIMACPFGSISRDESEKKIASKCDLCINTGEMPECVKNCPNEALKYE